MTGAAQIWRFGRREFNLSENPCVMGILNLTPDSFSDGSRYDSVDAAVDAALQMEADGADIIDIGGESTRPGAPQVSAAEELERVMPVIERLSGRVAVPLSIDTWKADVASAALSAGVEIVNDISAMGFDPLMKDVFAGSDAGVVLMHTRGRPGDMQDNTSYGDIVSEVGDSLQASIEAAVLAGISKERIVVDPGICFGKSIEGNLEIIHRLGEFARLGRPLLIGTSRKSFIGKVLGRGVYERLFGTTASVAVAMMNGASLFRVHDVRAVRDTVDMVRAIQLSG